MVYTDGTSNGGPGSGGHRDRNHPKLIIRNEKSAQFQFRNSEGILEDINLSYNILNDTDINFYLKKNLLESLFSPPEGFTYDYRTGEIVPHRYVGGSVPFITPSGSLKPVMYALTFSIGTKIILDIADSNTSMNDQLIFIKEYPMKLNRAGKMQSYGPDGRYLPYGSKPPGPEYSIIGRFLHGVVTGYAESKDITPVMPPFGTAGRLGYFVGRIAGGIF